MLILNSGMQMCCQIKH